MLRWIELLLPPVFLSQGVFRTNRPMRSSRHLTSARKDGPNHITRFVEAVVAHSSII
jgi:hypothetical protein